MQQKPISRRMIMFFWIDFGILLPMSMVAIGAYLIYEANQIQKNWLTVPAIMTRSEIREEEQEDKEGNYYMTYTPYLEFEYEQDAKKFTGTYVGHIKYSWEKPVKEFLATVPYGSTISVKVNPNDASKSRYFPPKTDWLPIIFIIGGIASGGIFGGVIGWLLFKKRKEAIGAPKV